MFGTVGRLHGQDELTARPFSLAYHLLPRIGKGGMDEVGLAE
jgi:hypothetical protein